MSIHVISDYVPHLLNIVIRQRPAILKLLAGEDEALLVRRDALFVLDLALHIVDRVARLHLEGDGLAREGLDEAVVFVSISLRIGGWMVVSWDVHLH